MRRGILGALVVLLCAAPGAAAQPQPYDGHIPFDCTLQQAGTGTSYPFPAADPFCVDYDKTHQSVSDLGVVDFLSKEPARVAAASGKCFYFQRDHWTGSLTPGGPETYHWDGSYFFDKARGAGGVYVENFRVGGQTGDPSTLPGFPADWKPYFSAGRGGVWSGDSVKADPNCAAKNPRPGSGAPAVVNGTCRVPGGRIGNGIGGVRLGGSRDSALSELGLPVNGIDNYLVWCLDGGGRIVAALRRDHVKLMLTDAAPFDTHGIRVGTRRSAARKSMRHERRFARVHGAQVLMAKERRRKLFVAFRHGRVTWIAVSGKRVARKRAVRWLRGASVA